jgi:hypothetical protein
LRVRKVLRIYTEAVGGVTNTVAVVADVKALRDPVVGDTAESVGQAVDVLGSGSAVGVDVARQA